MVPPARGSPDGWPATSGGADGRRRRRSGERRVGGGGGGRGGQRGPTGRGRGGGGRRGRRRTPGACFGVVGRPAPRDGAPVVRSSATDRTPLGAGTKRSPRIAPDRTLAKTRRAPRCAPQPVLRAARAALSLDDEHRLRYRALAARIGRGDRGLDRRDRGGRGPPPAQLIRIRASRVPAPRGPRWRPAPRPRFRRPSVAPRPPPRRHPRSPRRRPAPSPRPRPGPRPSAPPACPPAPLLTFVLQWAVQFSHDSSSLLTSGRCASSSRL